MRFKRKHVFLGIALQVKANDLVTYLILNVYFLSQQQSNGAPNITKKDLFISIKDMKTGTLISTTLSK